MTKQAFLCALTATCGLLVFQACKSETAKDAKAADPALVLEYGGIPMGPLRYKIPNGFTGTSTTELSITSMMIAREDSEEITRSPGLRFVSASGPAIKLPNGNARFDTRIVNAEAVVPPGLEAEVEKDLNTSAALLEDVGGWIEIDDRGIVRRSELNQAAKNPDIPIRLLMTIVQARSSLARIILPAEDVGPNARWQARKRFKVYGLEMQQVDTYTLLDKSGDQVKLAIQIEQSAPAQTVTFEERGMEFELRSLSMRAEGHVILDLNAIEGHARVKGRADEILAVKTDQGTELVELDSAFELKAEVSHEVAEVDAEAVDEASTETRRRRK